VWWLPPSDSFYRRRSRFGGDIANNAHGLRRSWLCGPPSSTHALSVGAVIGGAAGTIAAGARIPWSGIHLRAAVIFRAARPW
jgi:hypothetical protein